MIPLNIPIDSNRHQSLNAPTTVIRHAKTIVIAVSSTTSPTSPTTPTSPIVSTVSQFSHSIPYQTAVNVTGDQCTSAVHGQIVVSNNEYIVQFDVHCWYRKTVAWYDDQIDRPPPIGVFRVPIVQFRQQIGSQDKTTQQTRKTRKVKKSKEKL